MKFLIVVAALFSVAFGASLRIRPRLDGRIVGGEPTTIEEYPYQISLLYFGSHICGGSIVSDRFIVTAAHCTDGSNANQLSIRAGSSTRNSGGVVIDVARINQNPDYNARTIDYDISVLELASSLTFSEAIGIVDLPEENQAIEEGADAVCTGWGTLTEGGVSATQLQTVTVQIVSNTECNVAYGGDITDRMICAAVPGGGKDACQGDSGGPLVVDGQLVGIVSWGIGCARPDYPGVYSSVPALRSYITENAGV